MTAVLTLQGHFVSPSWLLKTLQTKTSQPAIPMSHHSKPEDINEPADFKTATHVYVRVDKPDNLGNKFQGPFVIVSRPSNTTIVIRVGYNKDGLPRYETVHWNNCRIAYLHPEVEDAERPRRGRPRTSREKINMAEQTTLPVEPEILAPTGEQPFAIQNTHRAMSTSETVTQPRKQSGRHWLANSAEPAEPGSIQQNYHSHTGPPPMSPFSPQPKQNPSPALPDDNNSGPEPGATSSPKGYGSHLQLNEPSSTSGAALPASPTETGHAPQQPTGLAELADHDYSTRIPHLIDHDYYRPAPDTSATRQTVRPPPGFENYRQGRPKRNTYMPAKFSDYQLSTIAL